MNKRHFLTFILVFLCLFTFGQFQDTSKVDVLHYTISLDSINIPARFITASCKIVYTISKATSQTFFMLKSLSIDSIASSTGTIKSYTYISPDISINYKTGLTAGFKDSFTVYYKGKPVSDTWGGFYFSDADGGYAYNMGIAMADFPHAYGRVWFPCIDLFSDRATYTIIVKTLANQTSMSGGLLKSRKNNSDGSITWTWEIKNPVPTDLVSVAVGPYSIVESIFQGLKRPYPIVYGVRASDSNNMLASFINIQTALNIFESKYGPYRFDKVGFSVVPFNGGAMEHSENISYPKYTIDGTTNYESLWAHELSHSWWGNLVKCYTSEDMWLNEGWASYSEHVFTEGMYGRQSYLDDIRAEQRDVLQYAHIKDGSALPLSPIPTAYTYGTHSYHKGSVVVHTLRTYLGDSLFFLACKKYLESMAFKNDDSYQLRDSFTKYTGIDLHDFFNEWVFQPGFPHFEILKYEYNQANTEYSITIKQRNRFNSNLYHNVPLKVSFYNHDLNRFDYNITFTGTESIFIIKTPWQAEMIALNVDLDISEAISKYYTELTTKSTYSMKEALMDITVKTLPSKALIMVEHHWIEPEHYLTNIKGIRFSDYRYWSVDGVFPTGFAAEATIKYNGTVGSNHDGMNYLDHTMNIVNEDSLVLLYRPDKLSPWINITNVNASFTILVKNDKKGLIKIPVLQKGDYCLGKYDYTASIGSVNSDVNFKVYPNPAKSELVIEILNQPEIYKNIRLIDSSGKILLSRIIDNEQIIKIETAKFKSGIYIIEIKTTESVITKKISIY
jgi:hypothetical protein